jgi:hypothetical protein
MLRSIECMHWSWRNYPFAWQKICTKGSGRWWVIEWSAQYDHREWVRRYYIRSYCHNMNGQS